MYKEIAITVLVMLSSATARPEPQFFFSSPYTALSAAYTAPATPYAPVVSAVPAVPAVPAVSALPAVSTFPAVPTLPNTYPGVYPVTVDMYSYAYGTSFSEVPVSMPAANYFSGAYSLPYRSYSAAYAPPAAYVAYRK